MDYCKVISNEVISIGVYFILQLLILFISLFIGIGLLSQNFIIGNVFLSLIFTYLYYHLIKFTCSFHNEYNSKKYLVTQSFLSLFFSLFLSIPICLSLFKSEINFQILLITGKLKYSFVEMIYMMPYGLYLSFLNKNNGFVILLFCIAIFLFISFIFLTPYLLMNLNKKSIYFKFKKTYERQYSKK